LADTSVNNTMMEGESALHSREVSFHGGGKTLSMAK